MNSLAGSRTHRFPRHAIQRRWQALTRYGPGYTIRVLLLLQVVPLYGRFLVACLRQYKQIVGFVRERTVQLQLARWRARREEIVRSGAEGYRLKVEELGLGAQELARVRSELQRSDQVVLGEIDRQGRVLSHFGPIPHCQMVDRSEFEPRNRFQVRLVVRDGIVGIQKNYRGRAAAFLNELLVLKRLGDAHCRVPTILDVDFDKQNLTTSFIQGPVLRDALEARGARLKTNEISDVSLPSEKNRSHIHQLRSSEGTRLLNEVLNEQTLEHLFQELQQFHAAGVIGNDIKYGNVILEERSGEPYWIDFDHAFFYPNTHLPSFRVIRDRDIEKFNTFFGTTHTSYQRLKRLTATEDAKTRSEWSVPVYFGSGLALGSLWDAEAGFGCWECFIKHHLPTVAGKRVLDLYVNNAFYTLQIARRGAQIVALEPSAKSLAQAKLVQAGIEWADNVHYPVEFVSMSLSDLPKGMGAFQVTTALFGICVVDPAGAARVVQQLGALADMFVLYRGFVMPDGTVVDPQESAHILRENGFPMTTLVDAGRNGWRLFIGSKE